LGKRGAGSKRKNKGELKRGSHKITIAKDNLALGKVTKGRKEKKECVERLLEKGSIGLEKKPLSRQKNKLEISGKKKKTWLVFWSTSVHDKGVGGSGSKKTGFPTIVKTGGKEDDCLTGTGLAVRGGSTVKLTLACLRGKFGEGVENGVEPGH